jgi:octaheme c-type cytochrome (tetrathionate reductase family)
MLKLNSRALLLSVAFILGLTINSLAQANTNTTEQPDKIAGKVTATDASDIAADNKEKSSTADHSKFKVLQVNFKDGPAVTKACISCHTEASKQLHKTTHWSWDYINADTQQHLGKKNVINNYCTSVPSNYKFCSACHIGYGWKDDKFDFKSEENVDCLVCHDTTASYKKLPGLAGHPNYQTIEWPPNSGKFRPPVDLQRIAKNVGRTSRETCGTCHFRGGGGDAVKHGDLDSALINPDRYLDVHMDAKGLNFSCSKCHSSDNHQISGSRYNPTAADEKGTLIRGSKVERNATTCVACHGNAPHSSEFEKMNEHTKKLACQTCHIPAYARGKKHTKMSWDWSTLGDFTDKGERKRIIGSEGAVIYDSKKGSFTYERYVIPEYQWFNGVVEYTLTDTVFDPDEVLKINSFKGDAGDVNARIWPTKVFRGKQMFDKGNNTLVITSLSDDPETALWKNYDINKAVEYGMKHAGKEFSGEVGWVETEMSWPITHMVAPKEDTVQCYQCHKDEGRLAGIKGVYIPGANNTPLIDKIGFTLALLTLFGVLIHGLIRYVMFKRGG